jgi:D-alanyl-D-alanine carboxypeptidase
MNRKALQIGANDSSFQNTNGLDSDSPEHKTTAMDLALIARYCMGNEIFKNIVSTDLDIINISGEPVDIFNTNVLLFFDYIKGIKTGFTNNAGYCLVLYSERQGLKLITVILNSSEGSRESDALNLINWANDNFTHKKIIDSDKEYKLIEISHQTKNDNYGLFSSLYSYVYPEEDFINLTNVDDEIVISDNLKQSVSPGDMVYLPLMPVDLPSGRNYVTGKLTATVNENLKKDVNLVLREDIDSVKITVALVKENNARVKYILIFLISFYFLIFILIIVRNLLKREKNK